LTNEQREIHKFLLSLAKQVDRGEVAGVAVGILSPDSLIEIAFLGACRRNPLQTIGVVRIMSRYVEDHMLSLPQGEAEPDPPDTRKP
jgi:hypothetical protein